MGDFHEPYGAIVGVFGNFYPLDSSSPNVKFVRLSENLENFRHNLVKTLQAGRNLLRFRRGYYLPRR